MPQMDFELDLTPAKEQYFGLNLTSADETEPFNTTATKA